MQPCLLRTGATGLPFYGWIGDAGMNGAMGLCSDYFPMPDSPKEPGTPADRASPADPAAPGLDSTDGLVRRAQAGEREALERLCERYLPRVRNWARGRVPPWARGLNTTNDIMVETMSAAVQRVATFEERGVGGFKALVWRILLGKVVDELRRAGRRPIQQELSEAQSHPAPSPVDVLLVRERLWKALEPLSEDERQLLIAHKLMGYTHAEIAESVGAPSGDAVRLRIARALEKVAWPSRP